MEIFQSLIPIAQMTIHRYLLSTTLIILSLFTASYSAWAAGHVQLELVGDSRTTAMTFQDWAQALGSAGIKNVRIRTSLETDTIGIQVQGMADHPVYIVTGMVVSRDELMLPGARFKRSEVKKLAQWLEDIAQNGPIDRRPQKVAFGLTAEQYEQVRNDLATDVGFSTKSLPRREAVEKIARKLSLKLRIEDDFAKAAHDDKVENELGELSCGTALACLLRPMGYCLVPQLEGQKISYAVVSSRTDVKQIWPVGRQPKKPLPEILPDLYEFLNVNVQNVSAVTALEEIGKRLKTPVLYDHVALARHDIDPEKTIVNFRPARTNYSMALSKMLFAAGLKYEVREDDAGEPFLWITTLKPM